MEIDTPNTRKVIKMLKTKLDNREIILDDIKTLPKYTTYLGVCKETDKKIFVYINTSFSKNTQEAIFIHEILHKVLHHEGYPDIQIHSLKLRKNISMMS